MCIHGKNSVFIPIFEKIYINQRSTAFFHTHEYTVAIPQAYPQRQNIPTENAF
jgi:hypothetical protein